MWSLHGVVKSIKVILYIDCSTFRVWNNAWNKLVQTSSTNKHVQQIFIEKMKHMFQKLLTSRKYWRSTCLSPKKLDYRQVGFRGNKLETLRKRETLCGGKYNPHGKKSQQENLIHSLQFFFKVTFTYTSGRLWYK